MSSEASDMHFPSNISLERAPLIEAWFELRWRLTPDQFGYPVDEGFPFALGVFFANIKEDYPHQKLLSDSQLPDGMFPPHAARYQFRKKKNEWPLIQLGHGVASLNFTEPYDWDYFLEESTYLRHQLLKAYENFEIDISNLSLNYRNAVPFDDLSSDLLTFLETKMNTQIKPPQHIPGQRVAVDSPAQFRFLISYDLSLPVGRGTLGMGLATQRVEDGSEKTQKVVLFDLAVESVIGKDGKNHKYWSSDKEFSNWLISAHDIIHEWFFSLIEGDLWEQFKQ